MKYYSNAGSFRFKDGKMLFLRVGPAAAQKQTHNRRPVNMETLEPCDWDAETRGSYDRYVRRTPVSRGIWVFPYPFEDAFFYHHVFRRQLPKRLRDRAIIALPEDQQDAAWEEQSAAMLRIRQRIKIKRIWWDGPLYSHVTPHGGYQNWFRWPSPREFCEAARKHLWCYNRIGDEPYRVTYSRDGLECFLPMKA